MSGPCTASPPFAPSRMGRRRAWVLVAVHVVIALHIGHWLATGRSMSPLEPSEAMEFSKHSVINAGFVLLALLVLSTLVLGRFFCGWACHLVALQDLCRHWMLKIGIRPRPLRSRLLAWVPAIAAFYMFFWPLVARLWLGHEVYGVRTELETDAFWATFPGWWMAAATFAVCGFGMVYLLGSKGFCTYACPYGALFGAADRLAPGRIRVTDDCEACGHCTNVCTSNVEVSREVRTFGMVVDPGCMKCLDCVSACPKDALYFGFGKPSLGTKDARPRRGRPWTEELVLGVAFAACFFAVRGQFLIEPVPFLMSLGVAGMFAFVVLRAFELWTRPDVSLFGRPLARDGRRTGAGNAFLAVAIAGSVGVVYLGFVRYSMWRGATAFEPLVPARNAWYSPERPEPDAELRASAEEVVASVDRTLAWTVFTDPRQLNRRAWARMVLGDERGFEADLERSLAIEPAQTFVAEELANNARWAAFVAGREGREAEVEGHLLRAAEHYRRALSSDPGRADLWDSLIAVEEEALGEGSTAREELSRAVARRDWDASLIDLTGQLAWRANETARAEAAFRAALELQPEFLAARLRLAQLVFSDGRREDALAVLRAGPEARPDSASAWSVLADGAFRMGALHEARTAAKRALELDPDLEGMQALLRRLDASAPPPPGG